MIKLNAYSILLFVIVALLMAEHACGSTFIVSSQYIDSYSIQKAINGAEQGDRIIVKSGVYKENINVTKSLILVGVDSGRGLPVIDAGNKRSALVIVADGVQLEGFEIRNSGSNLGDSGITVLSKNNIIRDNKLFNNTYGINLEGSSGDLILNNLADANDVSIYMHNSRNVLVKGCTAMNNLFGGIFLSESGNNTLEGNTARKNAWAGIILSNSAYNAIVGNTVMENDNEGIWMLDCDHNLVRGNLVSSTYVFGLRIVRSKRNVIDGNNATGNLDGVSLEASEENIITNNSIARNLYGVYMDDSNYNQVYLNDIFGNEICSAYSSNSTNIWNTTVPILYEYRNLASLHSLGNYWGGNPGRIRYASGVSTVPYSNGLITDLSPLIEPTRMYRLLSRA